ncbi:NTP transferase domain-containing protein [Candidatus Woesearchaeota archaeon]|nr:NTP transferase domain-containing protein [Candidatus Woesearchaeota archaeon]MBW3021722.1 NTP transferase domain-containing protein [Candidatus Woesearchaeota archaeon]
MKAILVCAGYATRLFPLTENYPKNLLVIGNKPIIEHIIEKIEETGLVDEIIITTNNKYTPRFLDWRKQFSCKTPIKIINNGTLTPEDALGAVGDIHFALKKLGINDDVLIIAGDNLFEFSLKDFINFKYDFSKVALYDLKDPAKLRRKFGTVLVDNDNKIIDFEEKPENPKSSLAATMCYLIKKDDVKQYDEYVQQAPSLKDSGDFFTYLITKVPVYGFSFSERWFDIGNFDGLEEADKIFSSKTL